MKLIAGMIAFATVLGVAGNVNAATAEELAAQIEGLQSQLASLQGQLGTTTTTTTGTTGTVTTTTGTATLTACAGISFTRNLTLGTTGTDVKCLQALLNSSEDTEVANTGVGSQGMESTTFGGLTKAAVIKFQNKFAAEVLTPVGLTAGTGFVGAQTRIKLNAMLAGTTTTTTPGNTTDNDNDSDDTTSTNGQEGEFTVALNSTPSNNQKAREGAEALAVMGLKIKATGSDINIQRVTLAFNAKPYDFFKTVYLYDGSTVVASADLDSDNVSKVESDDYRITLSSFENKFVVAEGATKVLTVKVDVVDGLDSDDIDELVTIYLPSDSAIRGVDGAGLNQYAGGDSEDTVADSGDADIARTVKMQESTSSEANLSINSNDDTPLDHNVVADSNKEIKDSTLLVFDAEADSDDLTITDINDVQINHTGSTDYPDTVYLYNSSNEVIGEDSPNSDTGLVSFSDLEEKIADGDTETFTLKFDYDTDDAEDYHAGMTFSADVAAEDMVVENSEGDELRNTSDDEGLTSTAEGNLAIIYQAGPMFTISRISTSTSEPDNGTSTISATFEVVVEAEGGDVFLPKTGAFDVIYALDDVDQTTASSISYTKPSAADLVTDGSVDKYKVSEDESITFKVNATNGASTDGYYDLRMGGIEWNTDATVDTFTNSTYMLDDSAWISDAEYLHAPIGE